jgi:hypothetical protein
MSKAEADNDHHAEHDQRLRDVVHREVADLVAHHRTHFGFAGAPQEVVVEPDGRRAEETRDVGTDARRLPRSVEDMDVVHRTPLARAIASTAVLTGPSSTRLVGVEQRLDEHRGEHDPDGHEDHGHGRGPTTTTKRRRGAAPRRRPAPATRR